jgi:hypothetical protein
MDEESGVLGNLPRSRPGTRSQKRSAPAARASTQAQPRPRPKARPKPAPAPEHSASDPVSGAVRTAAKVAGGGLKLANGLTREVLRRLPKP